jgi:hypothetical protein
MLFWRLSCAATFLGMGTGLHMEKSQKTLASLLGAALSSGEVNYFREAAVI